MAAKDRLFSSQALACITAEDEIPPHRRREVLHVSHFPHCLLARNVDLYLLSVLVHAQ